eukprot:9978482-Lingulodinium_polyedra.AAC.1
MSVSADCGPLRSAEKARQELVSCRSGVFYKALTLFATGILIQSRANDFFLQRKLDEQLKLQLQALQA